MRIRWTAAIGAAALVAGALLSPSTGASAGRGGGKLSFTNPVALDSFSPVRTVVGDEYSVQAGQDPAGHEWAGEPSIQVDSKGTIFVAGVCCVAASSPVWYSKDGGKTFEELSTPGHAREWSIGAEGDLAVDDEGRTFFIDTYVPGMITTRWSDHGDTWDFTAPTAGVTPGVNDRPWLAYSKEALSVYVNYGIGTQVYSSTDGGQTWTSPGMNSWAGSTDGQPFFPGHVAADRKTGTTWLAGVVHDAKGRALIGAHVSKDGGATFKESVVSYPQRKDGFTPMFVGATAVDDAGNGYVTWATYDNKGCDVYYASSTDDGKSWNEPVRVSSGRGCATFPWLAAGDDGKIAVVWYETPFSKELPGVTGAVAYQDAVPADATWGVHAAAITNATSAKPSITSAEIPTKGPILLGPLTRELWDFFQVAIGPDGRMYIAFVKKFTGEENDTGPQTWFVKSTSGPRLK